MNGFPDGANEFDVRCEANKSLSGVETCTAVSCGEVPAVEHAHAVNSSGMVAYPEDVRYACDDGYTTY